MSLGAWGGGGVGRALRCAQVEQGGQLSHRKPEWSLHPATSPRPDSQQVLVAGFERSGALKWKKENPHWVLSSNFILVRKWLMRAASTARCQLLRGQTDWT